MLLSIKREVQALRYPPNFVMSKKTIFTNPELLTPSSDVMLDVVRSCPGITMGGIHEKGYRLIWDALNKLIEEGLVFYERERFYPNN